MVVPTLPGIGVTPPLVFFTILEQLTFALVLAFLLATVVSTCLHPALFQVLLYCMNKCCRSPRHRDPGGHSHSCLKIVFLRLGRWLCVSIFPALFKLHKSRSEDGSQMTSFIVFLDREVENIVPLVAAFCWLAYGCFCISTLVFFRYFPVEESGECLEKDDLGRPHFCYLLNSSLPVDCANYSVTELREMKFQCYTIAFPGLGIAAAAAFGLAKVATVGITIYVKVTEAFFDMTKNPPQNLPWCCCYRLPRTYANKIYIYLSWTLLTTFSIVSPISITIFTFYDQTDPPLPLRWYYYAYMLLPAQVSVPLMYVIKYLEDHCDKEEYASLAAEQRPPGQRDLDHQ